MCHRELDFALVGRHNHSVVRRNPINSGCIHWHSYSFGIGRLAGDNAIRAPHQKSPLNRQTATKQGKQAILNVGIAAHSYHKEGRQTSPGTNAPYNAHILGTHWRESGTFTG